MNQNGILFLSVVLFFLSSCQSNSNTKNGDMHDSLISVDSSKWGGPDSLKITDNKLDSSANKNTQAVLNDSMLNVEDYSKQYTAHHQPALKRYLEQLRKKWKNVPNPFIATYMGNDFGDYHHILFKDANGVEFDFGQAKNNYGPYKLHELSGQYEDNPEYLGKKFNVYWDWVSADFLCCDGEYDKVNAYLPSITKLELVKH